MGFAAELERVTEDLAALCRRSFGPCGEETLLFRPPDAPIVTGEGSAVLAAWKRGLDSNDPLAIFLLTAANGVHLQLGDASSEFILLVDAAVKHPCQFNWMPRQWSRRIRFEMPVLIFWFLLSVGYLANK
ncbi:hypothetical protein PInf_014200 [Phytophthora infestans]|nr:hypothetical protein PInf_014200 [Phytophthora infestans]